MPRLTIVAIGQGVAENSYPLFRKLRRHGVHYTQVESTDGWRTLLDRSNGKGQKRNPIPFAHWYVDGGSPQMMSSAWPDVHNLWRLSACVARLW